jgi:hypothetical protein
MAVPAVPSTCTAVLRDDQTGTTAVIALHLHAPKRSVCDPTPLPTACWARVRVSNPRTMARLAHFLSVKAHISACARVQLREREREGPLDWLWLAPPASVTPP